MLRSSSWSPGAEGSHFDDVVGVRSALRWCLAVVRERTVAFDDGLSDPFSLGLLYPPQCVGSVAHDPVHYGAECLHCADAPCKNACPVDAILRDAKGLVLIDNDLCIGCKECLAACPFGAMQFDDDQETAVKCDLCVERLKNDQAPACYSVCPTRCISWGATKELSDRLVQEALPRKLR